MLMKGLTLATLILKVDERINLGHAHAHTHAYTQNTDTQSNDLLSNHIPILAADDMKHTVPRY